LFLPDRHRGAGEEGVRLLPSVLSLGLLLGSVLLFAPPASSGSWTCSGTPYFNDPATELVVNGGFENDLANWYSVAISPTVSTTIYHSGAKSARVYSYGGAVNAAQNLAPPPAVYIFSYQFYVGTWGPGGTFAAELLANWNPSLGTADVVTQVWWRPPNTMLWRVWTRNGGTDISRTYLRTLTTGTWHVLETVIDGNRGTQCLFIDGSAVDTFSVSPATTFSPTAIAFGDISYLEDAGEAYYDDISIQPAGPPLPDYAPVNPQPSTAIAIGESLPVSLTIGVMNRVNVSANASSTIAFFNESTPGSPFMTFSVPPLAGNGTAGPFTATWVSPGIPGPYRIVAEVDHGGTVREADEGNNRYTWMATVYPPPITALSVGVPSYNGTYVTSATPLTLSVTGAGAGFVERSTARARGLGSPTPRRSPSRGRGSTSWSGSARTTWGTWNGWKAFL
jgi:hypothetical protein